MIYWLGIDVGTGDQEALAAGSEAFGDDGDLLGSLAETEDDLGEAGAERAVMVERGEAHVLIGEVAQASESVVYGEGAAFERLQQFSEFGFVDWGGPPV